jgi:hypothetical protein
MKQTLITLAIASSFVFAGAANAMTKEEHKAQNDKIEADYKAAKERCSTLKDNAQDICKVEAKGNHTMTRRCAPPRPTPRTSWPRKSATT